MTLLSRLRLALCTLISATLLLAGCSGTDAPTIAPARPGADAPAHATADWPAPVLGPTGWYWNAAESGTGFFFEAQGTYGFAGFFMYEEASGKAIWYVASGRYTAGAGGGGSFSGTLQRYQGGQAAAASVYTAPTPTDVGSVSINFSATYGATVQFPQRAMLATRFPFGGPMGTSASDRPETGWYWNPQQGGRGYAVELQGTQLFMAMFHYNPDGSPTWHIVQGDISSGMLVTAFNAYSDGQTLSGAFRLPQGPVSAGSYTLDFHDPCGGFVQLAGAPAVPIRRFAFGTTSGGAECRATSAARTLDNSTSHARQNRADPVDVGTLLQSQGIFGHYYDARQVVDLDGDSISELVVAAATDSTSATPIRVFRKTGPGTWADATSSFFDGAIPSQIHPRKLLVADFNNDNRPDLYFVDHGYDHLPFPGAANVLALSNASSGKLSIKTITGNPTQFHHCGAAGDIDNNGTIDLFACGEAWQNSAAQTKGAYLLLNDGQGNMTLSRSALPASLGTCCGLLAAELADLDGDGWLDLITGTRVYNTATQKEEFRTTVFWGEGRGSFSDTAATVLATHATFPAVYDIHVADIDGDGMRDLVLLNVRADLSGYYIQIWRGQGVRSFADESLARIVANASTWEGNSGAWFPWIHLADLNGDGKPDIRIGDGSANIPGRKIAWLNNGSGVFMRQP